IYNSVIEVSANKLTKNQIRNNYFLFEEVGRKDSWTFIYGDSPKFLGITSGQNTWLNNRTILTQFEKSIEEYSLNPNKATLDEVIYNTFLVFAVMLHEHQHFQHKRLKDEKGNIEIGDVLDKKLW